MKKQKQKQILLDVINRIDKELPNFKHIVKNLPYSTKPHQKAVGVYSFELLEKEVSNLQTIKKFKKDSKKIIELIQKKDSNSLIEHLESLQLKINKYIRKLKVGNNEEIIEFKPNFYGLGINLKALWGKIKG